MEGAEQEGLAADLTAFWEFTGDLDPIAGVAVLTLNVLFILLPLSVFLTALIKLKTQAPGRVPHITLAISSGAILVFTALNALNLESLRALQTNGTMSFIWVFLWAWMGLDYIRSARQTGLRPRWVDLPVLAGTFILLLSIGVAVTRIV